MKGRKRGCFFPLTFILLFGCITGHAADDSDDGKEEDILGIPLPPLKLGHSVCALKADEGPCKAIHMRFYFNIQSRECEIFEYGGCHGNANNFLTLEECQNKCVITELPLEVMLAKIKEGNYVYISNLGLLCNKKSPTSVIMRKTLESAEAIFPANLLSIVPDEEHPNHMNSSSPEEEHNQFPGIFVNLLPTAPNEEKPYSVNSSYPEEERKQFPSSFELPPIPSLCMTPMDRGLCRAKETRFFYNYATGRCRPFTYSGCGGNENNFTSRKSCMRICRKGMGTDITADYHERQILCMLWDETFLQLLLVSIGLIKCNS
ncbi:tissue factor pathway inhibitor isoform X3 [Numida meleagris]|uniref:tissue factor pathway inhibitor isoform X3 n=1 Tax=Numida meleagris TaxID=8996 RepID=UPI000B3DB5D1|nr:tissue factor pathway inhibitor isoform X3 [Numida meleagris]